MLFIFYAESNHGNVQHNYNMSTVGLRGITYGIQSCFIGVGLITKVKQRCAGFIIGWVTAWDCQVPYTLGAMSCRGAQRTS